MRAASLLLVFLLAKTAILWGHAAPLNGWSLIAYAWQDVAVALFFGILDLLAEKAWRARWPGWVLYGALVVYAAINVPVGRVLATPLTRSMLQAARGPLADSILLYANAANVLLVVAVLAAAVAAPLLMRRASRSSLKWLAVCALCIVMLGPAASSRADTRGMDRNVVVALFYRGGLTRPAGISYRDWREASSGKAENLARYAGRARGMNVVMVSLESTAAQYLSLYGASHQSTPNLTALASRAMVFDNAYAVYPESIKGLFSVLCSVFPAFDTQAEAYEHVPCRSIAEVLSSAGYRTAMFHSGRFDYLGMNSVIRNRGYQTLEDAGSISGNFNSSFGVDEPATVTRMLAWLDALPQGEKFFLTYLPIAGHHPYVAPGVGPFTGTAEIDQYRNALHFGDRSLGALAEGLRARGLADNTIWIIYGDHGEAFGQHQGNYGHTFFLYEENVHVPFIVVAPGLMRSQERVRKVVSLVDTGPTILDLLGIPVPQSYQGASMLDDESRNALFFADYSMGLLGLRDGPWKYVHEAGSGRSRLFDLERDPGENSNLASDNARRVAQYSQTVRQWAVEQETRIALKR